MNIDSENRYVHTLEAYMTVMCAKLNGSIGLTEMARAIRKLVNFLMIDAIAFEPYPTSEAKGKL